MQRDVVKKNIEQTLGENANQFIASVASLVNNDVKLARCDQKTILSACLVASALKLPINQNLGFAYIIPYENTIKTPKLDEDGNQIINKTTGKPMMAYEKVSQAQFQMGWKGFVQLALRSEKYVSINAIDVREGEIDHVDMMSGEIVFSEEFRKATPEYVADRESKKIIGYVSYFRLTSGFTNMLYMDTKKLEEHANKYSKAYKSGFGQWKDDPDAMSKKTVLKLNISKFGLMTSELEKAVVADQAITDGEKIDYADNKPVSANEMGEARETQRIIKHIEESKTAEELKECEPALKDEDHSVRELFNKKMKGLKK
jgi:recombination protein RecT